MPKKPNVIILAARGSKVLPETAGKFHTSIEWLMHAFKENGLEDITIIGGKEIDELAKKYPSVRFYFNPHWEDHGTISSLVLAEDQLQEGCIITYADVVYNPSLVQKLLNQKKGDISLVVDTAWRERYPKRSKNSLQKAEKVWLSSKGTPKKTARSCKDYDKVSGELAGLLHISPRGGRKLLSLYEKLRKDKPLHEAPNKAKVGMTDLLQECIRTRKASVSAITTEGQWAELDEPQDFGRFIFGTKSETLERLRPVLKNGTILPQVSFSVGDWKKNKQDLLAAIAKQLHTKSVIVRSSARSEDSLESSQAGKFVSVMNVDPTDPKKFSEAVETVVQSFGKSPDTNDQVLVQPQISNVSSSGVLFTCDIKTGGHYYVINDDTSGSTDTITAGKKGKQELYYVYKHTDKKHASKKIRKLVACAKDLERLTGCAALDIEYAFDKKDKLFIFQARPITSAIALERYHAYSVETDMRNAEEIITKRLQQKSHLAGKTTILGDMPDWNPAELIGAHPKPLAKSLFEELITKKAWREARRILGYADPAPERLMVTLCGHPYIDVRCSLNSYMPQGVPMSIREKIINEALDYLKKTPDSHDKLEFEVATTCYTPAIADRTNRWKQYGLTPKEQREFKAVSKAHTEKIIHGELATIKELIETVKLLDERRAEVLKNSKNFSETDVITFLLDDCADMGTVPFSILARMAFIGNTFLRSFRDKGAISQESYDGFLNDIDTVATEMGAALEKVRNKKMKLSSFLKTYGHLRPGTYEIESNRYDEATDTYFGSLKKAKASTTATSHKTFQWKPGEKAAMQKMLKDVEMNLKIDEVLTFIVQAIQGREEAKFLYTKNISDVLSIVQDWGKKHAISKSDLAYLTIEDIIRLMNEPKDPQRKEHRNWLIANAKHRYEREQQAIMPPLITKPSDIQHIRIHGSRPNFITTKKTQAPVVSISATGKTRKIDGAIVLIESADPGFDWIFTHRIEGLITKYGGAASHMAIRCAEFDLPAAIGVGQQFEKLQTKHTISLDCANHSIT